MLAHCHGAGLGKVGYVGEELLDAAATRGGNWKVKVYDECRVTGWLKCHDVVFTEAEFARLTHLTVHPLRNGTKSAVMYANLENAAQTLWRTGSVEHVAMRHLGPMAITRYWTGVSHNEPFPFRTMAIMFGRLVASMWLASRAIAVVRPRRGLSLRTIVLLSAAKCMLYRLYTIRLGMATTRTSLHRIHGVVGTTGAPRAPPEADGCTAGENSYEPARDTVGADEPDHDDLPKVADTDNGGDSPVDAEVAAGASEDRRTYTTDCGHVAVIGQEYDKDVPHNYQPLVGALVGPCQRPPNVYSKTARNVKGAVEDRITVRQKGCTLSEGDKKRVRKLVQHCIGRDRTRGIFSEGRVRRWAEEHFHLDDMASSKWSQQRLRAALEKLWANPDPKFEHKVDIKYECMPEGKPPRLLIADGDEGQLMALAVVKCFEDLLFEWMEMRSIKHVAKREAMSRITSELIRAGGKAIEGDGSAWDATCNLAIRNLIENPVLYHIMEILIEYGVVPEAWLREHSKANEKEQLKLFFKGKFETLRISIDSIRRSGHRGTSCLNWWINFVMWVSAIYKAPERYLDPKVRWGEDVTGTRRWWNGIFEGDDSIAVMEPPMEKGDNLSKRFLKFWSEAGFDMKIVYCDTRATVVGWHVACNNGSLTNVMSPELPRALETAGVSVSPGATLAVREGDDKALRRIAKASALARAADFAGILPTVSYKYLEHARNVFDGCVADREMSMRTFGEDGHGSTEIEDMIISENASVTPTDELVTLGKLGYGTTPDDLDRFKTHVWSMDPAFLTDYAGFRSSLPPNWRS